MFRWLDKMGVESDEGFALQFGGRFSMAYKEGNRSLSLMVDSGAVENGLRCQILDPASVVRWDPPSGELIPEAEKGRIFDNISKALEFQGLKLVLDGRKLSIADLKAFSPKIK